MFVFIFDEMKICDELNRALKLLVSIELNASYLDKAMMLRKLSNTGLKSYLATPFLVATDLNTQQIRVRIDIQFTWAQFRQIFTFFTFQTTFVFKRKYPVPLYKKNQSPVKLRGRHFVYDLIEDQNVKKYPNIEVILKAYVEGIGRQGEIVSVTPTYAYNHLLLPGLATYVTPANVEKYSKLAEEAPPEELHSSQFAQRVKETDFYM